MLGRISSPWQDAWGRAYGPHDTTVGWHFGTTQEPEILAGVYDIYVERMGGGAGLAFGIGNYYLFDKKEQSVYQFGFVDASAPIFAGTEFGFAATGSYGMTEISSFEDVTGIGKVQASGAMLLGIGPVASFDDASKSAGYGVGIAIDLAGC